MAKILILSDQIPNSVSAGNIQLLRLFGEYPATSMLAIGPRVPPGAEVLGCRYVTWEPRFTRLNRTRLSRWKRTLRAINIIPAASPERIRVKLKGFKPDVVLNLMQNSDYYEAAEKFCRAENIPLILIVHDTNEDFEPVFPWAQTALFNKDRRIYQFASARFCVSPQMAAFNQARFGAPGEVLYPIPDSRLEPRSPEKSERLRQSPDLTIGYAGSLGYGYGEMMLKLLPTFHEAGVRLELCSPEPAGAVAALGGSSIVKWHGYMESNRALQLLQERCDGLLLPYLDPPNGYKRLYSTHFPSKLCDYLQLGMPVIVVGPSLATGVQWWNGNGGNISGCRSLTETLNALKCSAQERVDAANNAHRLKQSFGLLSSETQHFFGVLESFASPPGAS